MTTIRDFLRATWAAVAGPPYVPPTPWDVPIYEKFHERSIARPGYVFVLEGNKYRAQWLEHPGYWKPTKRKKYARVPRGYALKPIYRFTYYN